ncbi:MAG TPA: FHA domain-containing protein [Ktedonobacterales bacterium]|nr:FHA domain-containing protein [Ktedonobacterales bacterium]
MSVTCSQGHENPDGSLYCDQCGEALPAAAPAAGAGAPPVPDYIAPTTSEAPAGAPGVPRLIIKEDGAEFSLEGKTEFLIGREDPVSNIYPDIDLTPHNGEDYGVSRMHAKIYVQGSQYLVEDLNSTNSTYVNRQKLAAKTPTPIKEGDELRFGKVEATFHAV